MRWIAIVPSLLVGACAASSNPPPPPPVTTSSTADAAAPATNANALVADETAPTPFTAEQIRDACPVGRVVLYRVEEGSGPPVYRVMKFIASDAQGADIESVDRDDKGNNLGPAEKQHATWEDLRKHALFPRKVTTIEDGVAETPAGKFKTRVYIVKGTETVAYFHFAMDRAGPPVFMYTEQNGKRIRSSILITNADLPATPLVITEKAPPVTCKTDDDCWQDDKGKPIARPKEHRGKKLRPCKDSEHIPVCKEKVCTIAAYKC